MPRLVKLDDFEGRHSPQLQHLNGGFDFDAGYARSNQGAWGGRQRAERVRDGGVRHLRARAPAHILPAHTPHVHTHEYGLE